MELAAMVSPKGVVMAINEAMAKSIGWPACELIGRDVFDFLPSDVAQIRLDHLRQCAKTAKPVHFEHERGGRQYVTTISPIFGAAGKVSELACFSRDVTQEKQLFADIQDKNMALRQMLEALQTEKSNMQQAIQRNIDNLIMPVIRRLRSRLAPAEQTQISQLEQAMARLTSPLGGKLRSISDVLTPTELRVCHLVHQGMTAKEIAKAERVSPATVNKHRENIRHKLRLAGKKVNLMTYLNQALHGSLPAATE